VPEPPVPDSGQQEKSPPELVLVFPRFSPFIQLAVIYTKHLAVTTLLISDCGLRI
jgi:hypothetical protein